ncbi:MAG: hypothetical protein JWM86_2902 [Thermoleophilia bacterium]|nr:hypothetical protein [Thermoleophilia bacterium]
MFARILVLALALTMLTASSALAATPPVLTGPTAASIATGKPTLTWTNGPTGETMHWISIGSSGALTAEGDLVSTSGGDFLSELDAVTSATVDHVLYAGNYFYVGYWRTPDFEARGYTPLQSFVVPTQLAMGPQSLIQYSLITATNITGSFVTNAKKAVATCAIYNGTRLVGAQKKVITYTIPKTSTRVYCSDIKVSEKLDGAKLKLVIKVAAGGKVGSKVSYFRAK